MESGLTKTGKTQTSSFPSVFFVTWQLMERTEERRGVQFILTKGYTEGSSPYFKLRKTHGCHKHIWWWRVSRLQSESASHTADKYLSPLPGIEPKILGRPGHSLKTIATALSRLCDKNVGIFLMRGYYAAYNDKSLPTFRDILSSPISKGHKLLRNFGEELPL